MSSTNRDPNAERREELPVDRDAYQSPLSLAAAVLERLVADGLWLPDANCVSRVFEPSAGEGNFIRALYGSGKPWCFSLDAIDPTNKPDRTLGTFTWYQTTLEDYVPTTKRKYDLIVGNPPFSMAEAHIDLCHELLAPHGVLAFILRLGHQLEAEKRALRQWRAHRPRKVYSLAPRPSFGVGTNDSTPYGCFVWQRGWKGTTELDVLFWLEGKPRRYRREPGEVDFSNPTDEQIRYAKVGF